MIIQRAEIGLFLITVCSASKIHIVSIISTSFLQELVDLGSYKSKATNNLFIKFLILLETHVITKKNIQIWLLILGLDITNL